MRCKTVDLSVLAVFRDAIDRVGAIANGLWLIAFAIYAGWIVFLLWWIVRAAAETGSPWAVLFAPGSGQVLLGTAIVGALPWVGASFLRIFGGLFLTYLAYVFLFEDGNAWYAGRLYGAWAGEGFPLNWIWALLVFGAIAQVAIIAQMVIASVGLVVLGRDKTWRAFASGEGHASDGVNRLFYWLGVGKTGFYRKPASRAVMLFAKACLAIGIILWASGFVYPALLASSAEGPLRQIYAPMMGAMFGAAPIAVAIALGFVFRRLFPPPRFRNLDDFGDRPIFLRSFRDDTVRLRNAWSLSPLPVPPDLPHSVDEIVLAKMPETIAIGRPTDVRSPFGVARHYLENVPWQEAVIALLDRSQLIFVSVDDTPGLAWEIGQIVQRGYARKAKFILHPSLATTSKRDLVRMLGVEIGEAQLARLRGVDSSEGGEVRLYVGPANRPAYRCMVGWMLHR